MMQVHVNGRSRELAEHTTLGRLVDAEVNDRRGVAVAVEGEVVPRDTWDDTELSAGAHVEIVGAVQGG